MKKIIEIYDDSWSRLSEAISDLAECFQNDLPNERVNYSSSNVISHIVRHMNIVMASLDDLDKDHINFTKNNRTSFNHYDILPSKRKISRYNQIQILFLDRLYDKTKATTSFRTDELSSFAKTTLDKAHLVLKSIKSSKQLSYKSNGNNRHTVTYSPFDEINIPKKGLSNDERRSLKTYFESSGVETKNNFKICWDSRNNEIHSHPIDTKISNEEFYLISEIKTFNTLLEINSNAKIELTNALISLKEQSTKNSEWINEYFPSKAEILFFDFDSENNSFGYKKLNLPDNRMTLIPNSSFKGNSVGIMSSKNTGLLIKKDSNLLFSNVTILYPSGKEHLISANSVSELIDKVPHQIIKYPILELVNGNKSSNLKSIINTVKLLKVYSIEFIKEKNIESTYIQQRI